VTPNALGFSAYRHQSVNLRFSGRATLSDSARKYRQRSDANVSNVHRLVGGAGNAAVVAIGALMPPNLLIS
jgi:hypothetical protein